jgi:hypothetical protein
VSTELTVRVEAAGGGRHKVTVANGDLLHVDTLTIASATSRKRFVNAVQERVPAADPAGLDAELVRLAAAPPPSREPEAAGDDPRAAELAKMPADVRGEAGRLLDDPDLLRRVAADIGAAGVAGEARLALTLYLAGTSAQLPKPLAVIVRGPSSSGKSYVLQCVAGLFPPEVVLHATSLTANALYYFPPVTLRHRFVVAGERSRAQDDERADATRALREMIEAGRLTKAVPAKESDRIVTRVIEQDGPIAYAETTTLGVLFDEDANRCLLVSTDEREEQTRQILAATAAAAAGGERPGCDRLRAVHHAAQRMVPRADVVIPFAGHVADLYPTGRLDARRSYRHVLTLVKAVALLHFRQRGRDGAGRVVATVADYAAAEQLARGPIGSAAAGISDGARQFLAAVRDAFGDREFSTGDAQRLQDGTSRRTKYNRLAELSEGGFVEQTEPSHGKKPAKWKTTDLDPDGGGVLPDTRSIIDRLET